VSVLDGYPVDLRDLARTAERARPWSRWSDRTAAGMPMRQSPFVIAEAALGFWQLGADGDARAALLRLADWLIAHAEPGPDDAGTAWYDDSGAPRYDTRPGWPSARMQGTGISALLRAHAITGSAHYLDAARASVPALDVPVAAGGVRRELDGRPMLETIPAATPVAHLAGWAAALWGAHELATTHDDATARAIVDAGLPALAAALPRYRAGDQVLASLWDGPGAPDLASPREHREQLAWLQALARIAPGEPAYLRAAAEWPALAPREGLRDRAVALLPGRRG
jgi:hypothetical protein